MPTKILSPSDYFLFPNLKIKLKVFNIADVAQIQEAVKDELKKVQKEEFSAGVQKLYQLQKPVYMPMEFIFNKKGICLLQFFDLKKNDPKTFGPHCLFINMYCGNLLCGHCTSWKEMPNTTLSL